MCFVLSPHQTNISALPDKTEKHKIASLSLKCSFTISLRLSLILLLITNTLPGPIAFEVTTLWRYTNIFVIIIIIIITCYARLHPLISSTWMNRRCNFLALENAVSSLLEHGMMVRHRIAKRLPHRCERIELGRAVTKWLRTLTQHAAASQALLLLLLLLLPKVMPRIAKFSYATCNLGRRSQLLFIRPLPNLVKL